MFYFWFLLKELKVFQLFSTFIEFFFFFLILIQHNCQWKTNFYYLTTAKKSLFFALSKKSISLINRMFYYWNILFFPLFQLKFKIYFFYPSIKSFLFQMLFYIEISIYVVHHVIVSFLQHNNFSSYLIILLKIIFFFTEISMFYL